MDDENYLFTQKIARHLVINNDTAGRGIKLIENFKNILTNEENLKQYLL